MQKKLKIIRELLQPIFTLCKIRTCLLLLKSAVKTSLKRRVEQLIKLCARYSAYYVGQKSRHLLTGLSKQE